MLIIANVVFCQTFETFQLTDNYHRYVLNSDKSFVIDSKNFVHILYSYNTNEPEYQILYYSVVDSGSNPKIIFTTAVDTFKQESLISTWAHDYSIEIDNNDSITIFYFKEITEHNENLDIIRQDYQVISRTISNRSISSELPIYETKYPIFNIEFKLDANGDFHGIILEDGDNEPEGQLKLLYTNKELFMLDSIIVIDSTIQEVEIQNLCFEIDNKINPHIFISNYDGFRNNYYLNHWIYNMGSFQRILSDSISGESNIFYRSIKTFRNTNYESYILILKDSIYLYVINDLNLNLINKTGIKDDTDIKFMNSVACRDSLIHCIISDWNNHSNYMVFSKSYQENLPVTANIYDRYIGIKINNKGYLIGLFRDNINNLGLYIIISKIPLNPLPILPPPKPELIYNDTIICYGDTIDFIQKGVETKWYLNDSHIHTGDSIEIKDLNIGKHLLKVSETILDMESPGDTINIVVNQNPEIFLGQDTVISIDDNLILDVGFDYELYYWNSIQDDNLYTFVASDYGLGTHTIDLKIVDAYGCYGYDTISITIKEMSIEYEIPRGNNIVLVQGLQKDQIYLKFQTSTNNTILRIYNINGIMIFKQNLRGEAELNLSGKLNQTGIYLFKFTHTNGVEVGKFVVY